MEVKSVSTVQPGLRTNTVQAANENLHNNSAANQLQTEKPPLRKRTTYEGLEKKLSDLERSLEFLNRRFDYRVHEETGELVVAIIDRESERLIRTIPPEYLLDIAAKIREFVGLIVDERY